MSKNQTKYIFVFGGVLSGLGKGIVASSLGYLLKSLNLRSRGVKIISCPSCARQGFDVIETVKKLEEKLAHIKTPITLSIIGCVVNGPGEASQTEIGITGGGKTRSISKC